MSKKSSAQASAWQAAVEGFSPAVRARLESRDGGLPERAEASTYDGPPHTAACRAWMAARAETPPDGLDPSADELRFGLVVCADAAWPTLHLFKTAEGLAARVAKLDGEDVTVWSFYGVPLHVTKGPARFLLLPDNSAVSVPTRPGEKPRRVDASEIADAEVEKEGYLGPPELADSAAHKQAKPDQPDDGYDD